MYEVTNAEEIVKESTEAAIRIDDDMVPAKAGAIWFEHGAAIGSSDLDAETIERIENAEEIGFAFNGRIPGMFQGFAVEIGDAREKVKNFLECVWEGGVRRVVWRGAVCVAVLNSVFVIPNLR